MFFIYHFNCSWTVIELFCFNARYMYILVFLSDLTEVFNFYGMDGENNATICVH